MSVSPTNMVSSTRRWWIELAIGLAAYLLLGAGVVWLKREYGTALWYPPVVVGTAMLLRLGGGAIPFALVADYVVSSFQYGHLPRMVGPIAVATVLEAWIVAVLLAPLRGIGRWGPAATARVVAAALLSAAAAATVGLLPLAFVSHPGAIDLRTEWVAWWLGDTTSHLALMPLVLAALMRPGRSTERIAPIEYPVVFLLAALLARWLVQGAVLLESLRVDGIELLLLPVAWGAMRYRPRAAFGLLAWTLLCMIVALVTIEGPRRALTATLDPRVTEAQLDAVVLSVVMLVTVTLRETQRESLARLAESEADLRAAQRTARMGSWELDLPSREVRWSDEMFRLLRLDPATTTPSVELWMDLLQPGQRDAASAMPGRTPGPLPTGPHRRVLRLGDGSELHVEMRVERRDHGDGRARFVGTIVDVSEAVALERRFLHAQRMESVGRLAGGVAHDFNNLLTVIRGFVDLVRLDTPSGARTLAHLAEIDRAAERGARITGQLLAFSRRSARDVRVVDVGRLVREFEHGLRRLIGEDIQVQIDARPDEAFAEADPGQLEQVLLNLVVNARDAMPQGGTLRIGVDGPSDEAGGHVHLHVEDTGVGMDAATRDRVFEPFFTTKEAGKGTGLGLATVFGIVEQHGGRVDVSSEPGRGARFDVWLPATPRAAERGEESPSGAAAPRGRGTLLVVEDDPAVRRYVREVLERHGWLVHTAADASEALAWFEIEGRGVDALLTDIVLPGEDGVVLAKQIRTLRPGLPVLFMTGYLGEAHHPATGDRVLRKPFRAAELLASLTELVGEPQPSEPPA